MRSKVIVQGISVILAVLMLAACGSGSDKKGNDPVKVGDPSQPAQNKPKETVKILWAGGDPDPQMILGVAIGAGFMKEEAIDFTYQDSGGTTTAMRMVETGQAQFAVALPSVVLAALTATKGETPWVSVYNYTPGWKYRMIALPNSPLTSVAELKGKKLGVLRLGVSSIPVTQGVLRSAGLDPNKDVKYVAVGAGATLIKALEDHVVDAFVGWDTNFGQLDLAGFKYKDIPFQPSPDMTFVGATGGLAHRDFIQKNPDVVERVGRAIAKATVFTQTNPRAAAELYLETYPAQTPKGITYEQALDALVTTYRDRIKIHTHPELKLGEWSLQGWKNELSMAEIKDLDKSTVDVSKLFSNQFVAAFNNFDPKPIIERAKNYQFKHK